MDKLILIVVILGLVFLYLKSNSNTENFEQFAPINWSTLSNDRCKELKDEMTEIQTTLQSCTAQSTSGQRDELNNKRACIDAVNRKIFVDRESASWCASAEGKKTVPGELLGTQPNKIINTIPAIQNDPQNILKLKLATNDNQLSKLKGGILENNFKLLENTGFDGYDGNKLYASV